MSDRRPLQSSASEGAAMDAFCEYLRLLELGEEPDFEAFCAARPDEERALRRLQGEYRRVTEILERLAPAASFSARLRARYGDSVDPGVALSGDATATFPPDGVPRPGTESLRERMLALRPSGGRYEPRGEIARGGMGAILKVWDRELRRLLAMKVVLASSAAIEDDSDAEIGERRLARFLEEAQITGQLDHPGIVPVHDLGIDSKGRIYFTMQLIEGRDLREVFELARLSREGWTRARVLWAMLRVCEAVAYAHSKGVVHRDLKPANVMVGRFGETYVMDWGLAKIVGREDRHDLRLATREGGGERVVTDRSAGASAGDSPLCTMDGDVVGTPAYMSPEQALGRLDEVGPQSDVYSVGAMLYHMLSGHMPFEPLGARVPSTTVLEAVRSGAPWPLQKIDPSCDAELAAICEKAMARDPGERYADMMALAEDLRAYLEGRVVRAYESGVLYEFRKLVARNRGAASALAALALLALLSVAVFMLQQQNSLERIRKAHAATEEERRATLEAKQEAERTAWELALERDRANKAKLDAIERQTAAEESSRRALENAEMTRRQSYRAQILAADYSLRLEDVAVAKASLAATDRDLRDWEWHHLRLATEGSTRELLRVDSGIADLAASADGSRLACIDLRFELRTLDATDGRLLSRAHTAPFGAWTEVNESRIRTALSPNGQLGLAAAHGDAILVFNAESGELIGQVPHQGPKTALAFSRDGLRMVSASDAGTAVVWENLGLGIRRLALLEGHEGSVRCAAPSPRGQRVLTGGADGTVRIFDAATGRELARLAGDRSREVTAVAWSPSLEAGREPIAVAHDDGSIAVWDARSLQLESVLHGHAGPVRALVFSEDGRRLYSGGDDMTLRSWIVPTGREERLFRGHDQGVTGLALIDGGARLISSSLDGTVRVWDPSWDPAVTVISVPGAPLSIAFRPDGRALLAVPLRGEVYSFDADTGFALDVLDAHVPADAPPELHQAAAASADGRVFATVGTDRRVRLRDAQSGALLKELAAQRRGVRALALSADGAHVATGSDDGSIWAWSWRESERPLELAAHRREVLALAFSPGGEVLASVGRDRALRLWDLSNGRQAGLWIDAHELPIHAVAFSLGGEFLLTAAGDGRARVWRQDARQPMLTLAGKGGALTAVAMSPDGRRIVTGSASGELALWDARTGDALLQLLGHAGPVADVAFSPDGSRIASCASDAAGGRGELRIWESNAALPRYEVRVSAAQGRERAKALVERMYRRHHFPARVLAALAVELSGDDAALRVASEREARLCAGDPDFLQAQCLNVLLRPDAGAQDCADALRAAERVRMLRGNDPGALSVLGAAQVRAGRYEDGLRNLRSAGRERGRTGPVERARDALFGALALQQLDQMDEARAAVREARAVVLEGRRLDSETLESLVELEPMLRVVEAELDPARAGAPSR